jgi:2-oxo-4-hydroxy-4-carboxy--5-ureidoimidazoline (OHCU) decarboxylase
MSSSSNPALPPISSFSSLPVDKRIQALDTLFEPSPELHKLMTPVLENQSFSSYDSLVDAVGGRLSALSPANSPQDKQVLYGILGSHPRLGASSAAAQAHLSELSRQEQANINAGSDQAQEQAARLSALNREYEDKYPGLRYVYVEAKAPFITG